MSAVSSGKEVNFYSAGRVDLLPKIGFLHIINGAFIHEIIMQSVS